MSAATSAIGNLFDAAPDLLDPYIESRPAATNVVEMPRKTLRGYLSEVDFIADTVEGLDDEQISAEARGELGKQLVAAIAGTREKIDNATQVLAMFDHLEQAALAEIERLKLRAQRFSRRRERLENYLIGVLEERELPRLDGNTSAITLKACPPSVVVESADALPQEYLRYAPVPDPAPDKAAIKKALVAGVAVPGCRLERAKKLVRS